MKPHKIGRYESGQAHCQICNTWIDHHGCHMKNGNPAQKDSLGWFCNCCNYRVRQKPRNKLYKEKLNDSRLESQRKYYDFEETSDNAHDKSGDYFFDEMLKKGLSKSHVQVLEKFHILRRKIIDDSSEIRGIRGESPIPPDSIVNEPHYLHNLVRGAYKPSGDQYALSIQTNPNSKWGVEIDFMDDNWTINYDFEDAEKYSSDIEALRRCFEVNIPIGVIYKHKKGVNEILGLGKIINHQETLFEITNFIPKNADFIDDKGQEYVRIACEVGDYSCPNLESSAIRRIKQNWFRQKLLEKYNHKCAFCGFGIDNYLKGSHIVPFKIMQVKEPINTMNPTNGILLCALCDIAFEKGDIMVDGKFEIIGNEELQNLSVNNEAITSWISNIQDKLPINSTSKFNPNPKFLKWKMELV